MATKLDDAAAAASDAAEDAAAFPATRGSGCGGGGGGGSLNPAKPDAKLTVKPDAKSPAVAKTVTFARTLPSRRPGAQDQFPHITCYNCGAKGHYSPQCQVPFLFHRVAYACFGRSCRMAR